MFSIHGEWDIIQLWYQDRVAPLRKQIINEKMDISLEGIKFGPSLEILTRK